MMDKIDKLIEEVGDSLTNKAPDDFYICSGVTFGFYGGYYLEGGGDGNKDRICTVGEYKKAP